MFCLFLQLMGTGMRVSEKPPTPVCWWPLSAPQAFPDTHIDPSRNVHTGLLFASVCGTHVCACSHMTREFCDLRKLTSGFYRKTVSAVVDFEEGEEGGPDSGRKPQQS